MPLLIQSILKKRYWFHHPADDYDLYIWWTELWREENHCLP